MVTFAMASEYKRFFQKPKLSQLNEGQKRIGVSAKRKNDFFVLLRYDSITTKQKRT